METNGTVQTIGAPRERTLADVASEIEYARSTAAVRTAQAADYRDVADRRATEFRLAAIDRFAPSSVGTDAQAALASLSEHLADEANLKAQHRAYSQQAEEAKAMVMLGGTIDGKNDAIRSAQLTLALHNDPAYQEIQREIANIEGELSAASNGVRVAQAQLDLAKALMRQGSAAMELLAS
jgi:hypothetical protein